MHATTEVNGLALFYSRLLGQFSQIFISYADFEQAKECDTKHDQ